MVSFFKDAWYYFWHFGDRGMKIGAFSLYIYNLHKITHLNNWFVLWRLKNKSSTFESKKIMQWQSNVCSASFFSEASFPYYLRFFTSIPNYVNSPEVTFQCYFSCSVDVGCDSVMLVSLSGNMFHVKRKEHFSGPVHFYFIRTTWVLIWDTSSLIVQGQASYSYYICLGESWLNNRRRFQAMVWVPLLDEICHVFKLMSCSTSQTRDGGILVPFQILVKNFKVTIILEFHWHPNK